MNLNPFDWRGPEFLLFYALLTAAMAYVVWQLRRRGEGGEAGEDLAKAREMAPDPYQVAFLRGGRYEVVHVAVVSLIERGLLEAHNKYLRTTSPDAADKARRPLDKAILTRFTSRTKAEQGIQADAVYANPAIMAEADHIGESLQQKKLLPDEEIRRARKNRIVSALIILWAVAGVKILLALSRGHTNIFFLILLAALAPIPLWLVTRRFRTVLGDKTYTWVQDLFGGLRGRRESLALNSTNSELTFLAAAYGMAALPASFDTIIEPLHLTPPKPKGAPWDSSGCGSSCASFSSCGSSSSCSGGGSSCGGGSCGGGGGCGGCGG